MDEMNGGISLVVEAELAHGALAQALSLDGEDRERELREAEQAMEALLHRIRRLAASIEG